jgi:hypothetical protein
MPTGLHTVYDLTAGVPINMDTAIYMLDPDDDPMITGVNADGMQILPTYPTDEIKFEWMDEGRLVPQATIAAELTTATAFITLGSANDRLRFSTGDLLRINKATGSEIVLVTGYATTAATLDVTRGFNSSTATNYATGATVVAIGTLLAEGSDPEAFRSVDRTERFNYTAIHGPFKIEMSRTEQNRRKYGVASEFTHQTNKRIAEINVMRNMALLYGTRYNDASTKKRSSGGLDYWITSNVDSTATQLTVANIQSRQQACYNAGGVPRVLVANPASLSDLNDLENTSRVRTVITDGVRGRTPVMVVTTEYGDVTIVRNRWCWPTRAFMYDREQATRRVFDPLTMTRLAKTGDADSVMMVCEEGLQFKGVAHAAKFTNLTYTA